METVQNLKSKENIVTVIVDFTLIDCLVERLVDVGIGEGRR
jgi:hypothetical protein